MIYGGGVNTHPITFVLIEAPVDAFDPDGRQKYQVYARCRALDEPTPVGSVHSSAEAAVAEMAFRRVSDIENVVGSLGASVSVLGRQVGVLHSAARRIEKWALNRRKGALEYEASSLHEHWPR